MEASENQSKHCGLVYGDGKKAPTLHNCHLYKESFGDVDNTAQDNCQKS